MRGSYCFGLSLSNYAATFTFKLCSQTSQLFGLHACTKKHEWLKNFDHALTTLPPNYPFITYVSFINWSNKFVWFQNSKISNHFLKQKNLEIIFPFSDFTANSLTSNILLYMFSLLCMSLFLTFSLSFPLIMHLSFISHPLSLFCYFKYYLKYIINRWHYFTSKWWVDSVRARLVRCYIYKTFECLLIIKKYY